MLYSDDAAVTPHSPCSNTSALAGKQIKTVLKKIARAANKSCVFAFLAFSVCAYPTIANAQGRTWADVAEENLPKLGMLCDYIRGSVRNVAVIEQDNSTGATLISARYDFRCGDNTLSDTVYMTFTDGGNTRTCHAYGFYGKTCTLDGLVVNR